MNWWLIALVVIGLLVVFKFKDVRHKLGFIIVATLILFLIASFFQLYSARSLDLTSFDGVVDAGKVYFSWLGSTFRNVADISGYAVKIEWNINSTEIGGKGK